MQTDEFRTGDGLLPEKDSVFFERRNDVEADAILVNLKARLEV